MFPLLTPYGRELLLDWHRSDPVDDFELRRDNIIAGAQGVSNPFVTDPTLAEYVWGRYADQAYDPDP
ncbi:ribonuclease, partial [Xanthomonas citri pv. citri]|nr:ribonuclease [Xanthomonas citri pv. citri]